jgi:hypothetical protein
MINAVVRNTVRSGYAFYGERSVTLDLCGKAIEKQWRLGKM